MENRTLIYDRLTASFAFVPDDEVADRMAENSDMRTITPSTPGPGEVPLWQPAGTMAFFSPEDAAGEIDNPEAGSYCCASDPITKSERERRKVASLTRIMKKRGLIDARNKRAAELLALDAAKGEVKA